MMMMINNWNWSKGNRFSNEWKMKSENQMNASNTHTLKKQQQQQQNSLYSIVVNFVFTIQSSESTKIKC